MYIAIEGIDTAGKSTQIALLEKEFCDAVITKEPGATDIGRKIRDIVLNEDVESSKAEFLLFLADRAEHIKRVIKPNLHKMIISDRSVVSGIAYAMVKKDIDIADILKLNHFATDGIYPDKVFLLQLTEDELKFRLSQKELDGIELRGVEYLLNIQETLKKAAKELDIELIIIDAKKEINEISQEIKRRCI
jgi:dTMP kinase